MKPLMVLPERLTNTVGCGPVAPLLSSTTMARLSWISLMALFVIVRLVVPPPVGDPTIPMLEPIPALPVLVSVPGVPMSWIVLPLISTVRLTAPSLPTSMPRPTVEPEKSAPFPMMLLVMVPLTVRVNGALPLLKILIAVER